MFYPVLRGGGCKKFQTRDLLAPLPVINDQSLRARWAIEIGRSPELLNQWYGASGEKKISHLDLV